MSTNISFRTEVKNLVIQDLPGYTDVVVKVFYSVIGTDGEGREGEYIGVVDTKFIESSFIPLNNLSEQEIIKWVEEHRDENYKGIKNQIENQIVEKQRNTRFIEPEEFPWN